MSDPHKYIITYGPCTGNPSNHLNFQKKHDGNKVKEINDTHGLNVKVEYDMEFHGNDLHTLTVIYSSDEESDLVAFKLLTI